MRDRLPDRYRGDSVRTTQTLKLRQRTARVAIIPDSRTTAGVTWRLFHSMDDQHIASCVVDMREDWLGVSTVDDALSLSFTTDCVVLAAGNIHVYLSLFTAMVEFYTDKNVIILTKDLG